MDSSRPDSAAQPRAARLYLVTPPVEDGVSFARVIGDLWRDVLPAVDVAAVLLRLADTDERRLINCVKSIVPVIQEHGIALVLDGHVEIVARSGADGAHLMGIAALNEAIGSLQPARIAGVGGLKTRHDAMLAGEAGADYVMFGEPDATGYRPAFPGVVERVAWWAEVFQPPCVGFAASSDEVAPLADAGADFVALGDWMWTDVRGVAPAVRTAAADLNAREPAL